MINRTRRSNAQAALIIIERARNTNAFKRGVMASKDRIISDLNTQADLSAYLRHKGGFSVLIRSTFADIVGDETVPGSFGSSFAIANALLPNDVADIRIDIINGLSRNS